MSPLALDPSGEWLYISNLDEQPKFRISRVNTLDGSTEVITAPPITGLGDYALALSPNGKKLVFLRAKTRVKSSLMILDIESRESHFLREFDHNIFRLSWNNNNHEIVYINKDNKLTKLNISTKETNIISSFQNKTLAPYIDNKGQLFVVNGELFDSDIYSLQLHGENASKQEKAIISSSFQDYGPEISQQGNVIAFTSNRNGIPQIWLQHEKQTYRLTQFTDFSFITDKQFSIDGKQLLFLQNNKPYILDIESKKVSKPLTQLMESASPIWMCDGKSILLSSKQNGSWNLYKISQDGLTAAKFLGHVNSIKSDCKASSYYVFFENKKGLFKLDENLELIEKVLFDDYSFDYEHWQVNDGFLYIIEQETIKEIYLETGEVTNTFAVNNVNGFKIHQNVIYYSRRFQKETLIQQLLM